MRLPRLFRTTSFRLAALYAVLFGVSVLILGVVTFWNTKAALEDQVSRRIEAEMAFLQDEFRTNGLDHLVTTVRERSRVAANLDYFVLDPSGRRLAGNLPVSSGSAGWVTITSANDVAGEEGGEAERVRALIKPLDGGYRLGVGEDLEQVGEIEDTFLWALASALAIVLVLGIGGGLLLGAGFLRRVDAITRTADAIVAGDLSRRIEGTGSGDDFDRLSASLNAMLDRIGGLMDNLRQVSSDIAHDLRTPLSHLRQRLEEATTRDLTATEYRDVVERAIVEADVLLGTFSALLRIAQIEAGVRRSAFRRVGLSDVLRTIADAYAPEAEEAGRSLRAEIEDGVEINGDRELLTQLFANLVENALHHAPSGTRTVIKLKRGPAAVVAEVSDDGPGIPESERAKVFQRFYRLERSRTSSGNGLGLSMAAAIAELHGAEIELRDNHPGLRVVIRFSYAPRGRDHTG